MSVKKIPWLDTVRVLSSATVIVGHYAACFVGFEKFDTMQFLFLHAGNVGVFLFFALSGYLVCGSLARAKSLQSFYRRKLIRIVIPFIVAYVVLGAALMVAGLIDTAIAERSPFYQALYQSGFQWGILIAMFPVDVNLTEFFDVPLVWFVGEWFMGVIIWMYLVAPPLYHFMRKAPLATFLASIALAVGIFYATEDLMLQGRIRESWWLFPARIPEFLLGMILFEYRDFFERNRSKILMGACIWTIVICAAEVMNFTEHPALMTRLFPLEPRSLLLTIPAIYLLFICAERLNEKFPLALAKFNGFSDVSYMAMLIQHVVIYVFAARLRFEDLHNFGTVLVLSLITLAIVYISNRLNNVSNSVERQL